MTVRAGFEYPDPPIEGGYQIRFDRFREDGLYGPGDRQRGIDRSMNRELRTAVDHLTNRKGQPAPAEQPRSALRAEPGALDQLIHALAQLHGEERQHG